MSDDHKIVKVGVGVLLVREGDGYILLGRRKGKLGGGEYALPGGHLEYGETLEECAAREVLEETGIQVAPGSISLAHALTSQFPQGQFYVTVFMKATVPGTTTAETLEKDKCEAWEWHEYSDLPRPLFLPLEKLVEESGFCL